MIKKILPYSNLVVAGLLIRMWIKIPEAWPLWLICVAYAVYVFLIGVLVTNGWRFVPPQSEDPDYIADQEADRDYYSKYDQQ